MSAGNVGEIINKHECAECTEARMSKCLVAAIEHDVRFHEERFQQAIAIFTNNDVGMIVIKCHTLP